MPSVQQGYLQLVSEEENCTKVFVSVSGCSFLCFSEDPTAALCEGRDLEPFFSINLSKGASLVQGGKSKSFVVKAPDEKEYRFVCATNTSKNDWVQAIQSSIGAFESYKKTNSEAERAENARDEVRKEAKFKKFAENPPPKSKTREPSLPPWTPSSYGDKPHSSKKFVATTGRQGRPLDAEDAGPPPRQETDGRGTAGERGASRGPSSSSTGIRRQDPESTRQSQSRRQDYDRQYVRDDVGELPEDDPSTEERPEPAKQLPSTRLDRSRSTGEFERKRVSRGNLNLQRDKNSDSGGESSAEEYIHARRRGRRSDNDREHFKTPQFDASRYPSHRDADDNDIVGEDLRLQRRSLSAGRERPRPSRQQADFADQYADYHYTSPSYNTRGAGKFYPAEVNLSRKSHTGRNEAGRNASPPWGSNAGRRPSIVDQEWPSYVGREVRRMRTSPPSQRPTKASQAQNSQSSALEASTSRDQEHSRPSRNAISPPSTSRQHLQRQNSPSFFEMMNNRRSRQSLMESNGATTRSPRAFQDEILVSERTDEEHREFEAQRRREHKERSHASPRRNDFEETFRDDLMYSLRKSGSGARDRALSPSAIHGKNYREAYSHPLKSRTSFPEDDDGAAVSSIGASSVTLSPSMKNEGNGMIPETNGGSDPFVLRGDINEAAEWSRLYAWMCDIDMGHYIDSFRRGGITKLSVVELLHESDLEILGVLPRDIPIIISHINHFSNRTRSFSKRAMSGEDDLLVPPELLARRKAEAKKSREFADPTRRPTRKNGQQHLRNDRSPHGSDNGKLASSTPKHRSDGMTSPSLLPDSPDPFAKSSSSSLLEIMLVCYDNGDRQVFDRAWNAILRRLPAESTVTFTVPEPPNVQNLSASCVALQLLHFNVQLHFSVFPLKQFMAGKSEQELAQPIPTVVSQSLRKSMSRMKAVLDGICIRGVLVSSLTNSKEFALYSGIVFCPNPLHNPVYSTILNDKWSSVLRQKLELFMKLSDPNLGPHKFSSGIPESSSELDSGSSNAVGRVVATTTGKKERKPLQPAPGKDAPLASKTAALLSKAIMSATAKAATGVSAKTNAKPVLPHAEEFVSLSKVSEPSTEKQIPEAQSSKLTTAASAPSEISEPPSVGAIKTSTAPGMDRDIPTAVVGKSTVPPPTRQASLHDNPQTANIIQSSTKVRQDSLGSRARAMAELSSRKHNLLLGHATSPSKVEFSPPKDSSSQRDSIMRASQSQVALVGESSAAPATTFNRSSITASTANAGPTPYKSPLQLQVDAYNRSMKSLSASKRWSEAPLYCPDLSEQEQEVASSPQDKSIPSESQTTPDPPEAQNLTELKIASPTSLYRSQNASLMQGAARKTRITVKSGEAPDCLSQDTESPQRNDHIFEKEPAAVDDRELEAAVEEQVSQPSVESSEMNPELPCCEATAASFPSSSEMCESTTAPPEREFVSSADVEMEMDVDIDEDSRKIIDDAPLSKGSQLEESVPGVSSTEADSDATPSAIEEHFEAPLSVVKEDLSVSHESTTMSSNVESKEAIESEAEESKPSCVEAALDIVAEEGFHEIEEQEPASVAPGIEEAGSGNATASDDKSVEEHFDVNVEVIATEPSHEPSHETSHDPSHEQSQESEELVDLQPSVEETSNTTNEPNDSGTAEPVVEVEAKLVDLHSTEQEASQVDAAKSTENSEVRVGDVIAEEVEIAGSRDTKEAPSTVEEAADAAVTEEESGADEKPTSPTAAPPPPRAPTAMTHIPPTKLGRTPAPTPVAPPPPASAASSAASSSKKNKYSNTKLGKKR